MRTHTVAWPSHTRTHTPAFVCPRLACPAQMIRLIKGIGRTMVELDKDPRLYVSRSFCVVECFATIDTEDNAMLVVLDYVAARKIDEILEASPVDVLAAQTRPGKEADKDTVDAFINGKNLADTMNARITVALREGAAVSYTHLTLPTKA